MPPLPPATKAIVLGCVAMFCLALFVPQLNLWLGLWPVGSGRFMPWQVVTYGFMHSSVAHLVFNMLGLWMFGAELERVWGQRRYLQFMLAGLLAAAATYLVITLLLGLPSFAVGASGALFALLLAYATVFARRQFDAIGFIPVVLLMIPITVVNVIGILLFVVMLTNRAALPVPPVLVPAMATVMAFGAIELFLGATSGPAGISHFAHLGGMLGGWLMIRFWRGAPPFGRRR